MDFLKLTLTIAFVIVLSSCGENISRNCTFFNWIGTYSGTISCGGQDEDVTVTILSDSPSTIQIEYISDNTAGGADLVSPDNCNVDHIESFFELTFISTATLDGDNLLYTQGITENGSGDTLTCVIRAIKD